MRYEKRELLGAGATAAVWRGVRILGDGTQQVVAIKEILHRVRRYPDAIERFCREARFCMALNHENVVRVYDLVRHGEHYQIIMEYVDGVTLQTLVEAGLQLPANVQRYIHGQVVGGLDGLHRERILHRDLSPGNVMVSRDGMVKLIDLGVAKDLAGPATDGGCKGTLPYMSPELLRGESIDQSSDLYSAIALLYYSLTGNAPVSGDTPKAILAKHDAGDVATIPALLPPDLRVILDDLLEPRVERTFQQAADILRYLLRKARGDSHYLATRDEVAIFVQSVMDDEASHGKKEIRITDVMSQNPRDDRLPAQLDGEPESTAGDHTQDPALGSHDKPDTSALMEVMEYCFSDQAPPDVRAAALRAALNLPPDVSDDDSDNAEEHETPDGSDILALLACLPSDDDDNGVETPQRDLPKPNTKAGADVQGDVANRILLALRDRYPVFQSIDRDAWTELLDDVQYLLRDYLVPVPDFDHFEDGILLAVQARYPEFKDVDVGTETWKAMFREVWVDQVNRIASNLEPELAREIIGEASAELEAGPGTRFINQTQFEEPDVKVEPHAMVDTIDSAPAPSSKTSVAARAPINLENEASTLDNDRERAAHPESGCPTQRRWRTRVAAIATLLFCVVISTFVYQLDRTVVASPSPSEILDSIDQMYSDESEGKR